MLRLLGLTTSSQKPKTYAFLQFHSICLKIFNCNISKQTTITKARFHLNRKTLTNFSQLEQILTNKGSNRMENEETDTSCKTNSMKLLSLSSSSFQTNDEYLKEGLKKEMMPKHIATILDGNRRWLKAQGRPLDYEPFFGSVARFVDLCLKWGVDFATIFVYSLNNLQRGKEANNLIFGQLERFLGDNMECFVRKNVSVLMIGERKELPNSLQEMINQVEKATGKKSKTKPSLELRLAICYTGTRDIIEATKRLCKKAKAGLIEPDSIDETMFDNELSTRGVPTPDLLIRSGDEINISNYLVWQMANTELYFTPVYAPEFSEVHFVEALRDFQQRYRSFGN